MHKVSIILNYLLHYQLKLRSTYYEKVLALKYVKFVLFESQSFVIKNLKLKTNYRKDN